MDDRAKKLEALVTQAVTLTTELSLALDKENDDAQLVLSRLRNLSVLAFEAMSKIVMILLARNEKP